MGWSDDYLEHHGILGQKWGVRRFQNPDGSLTAEGKKHKYNEDSDAVARGYAMKYYATFNARDKAQKAQKALYKDPKNFNASKEAQEYREAIWKAQLTFQEVTKETEKITKKYKDVKIDVLTEDKTGEQYVQTILTSKSGDTFVSELYLGAKIVK